MKKAILIGLVAIAITSCNKEEKENKRVLESLERFVGTWTSSNYNGTNNQLVIQKLDDSTLLVDGFFTAVPDGNAFVTNDVNGNVYTGDLNGSNLYFCRTLGNASECGDFQR